MTSHTQQARAESGNTPPANNSLLPGQIYLELADPMRIWCGVPTSINANGVRLIFDASVAAQALNKTGDTATGLINFNGGVAIANTPATAPVPPADSNTNQIATASFVLGQAATTAPLMDAATAAPGSATRFSRGDHVHPTDATRAPIASPTFTGTPTLTTTPAQDDNTLKIADTAFVINQASTVAPIMDSVAAVGTSLRYARADHVHPSDTTRGVVIISDVPPSNPSPGTFWFDSVGVQLYLYYNDGTSSQFVPANNQALAGFLALSGGTMTGPLTLAADPTTALGAATKEYADAAGRNNTGRNLADNAQFRVQQRGAGPFTGSGSGYTADRFWIALVGDTVSASIINLTDAQRGQIGDEAAMWGLQNTFTGTSGATSNNRIAQSIERLHRLSGKTVTVSFFAVAGAALNLGVSFNQNFGTGGSPSATVFGNGQAVALGTSFARYQLTFNLPSIAGMTLGTNGDDVTVVNFWYSAGSNYAAQAGNIGVQSGTVTIWGVQVEIGSQATPLEKLDPETDLARCQRFYQQHGFLFSGYMPNAGSFTGSDIPFPTTMRAAPSTTLSGLSFAGTATGCGGAANPNAWGATPTVNGAGIFQVTGTVALSADL